MECKIEPQPLVMSKFSLPSELLPHCSNLSSWSRQNWTKRSPEQMSAWLRPTRYADIMIKFNLHLWFIMIISPQTGVWSVCHSDYCCYVCLPVFLFVCLSVCLCSWLFACVPVCVPVCLFVCLCPSDCLPVRLVMFSPQTRVWTVCQSDCCRVCLPVFLFVCLLVFLFVCLFV